MNVPTNIPTMEQLDKIPEYFDKWLDIGLSTERADRARAEAGVRKVYEGLRFPAPRRFLWFDSPLAGAVASRALASMQRSYPSGSFGAGSGAATAELGLLTSQTQYGDGLSGIVWPLEATLHNEVRTSLVMKLEEDLDWGGGWAEKWELLWKERVALQFWAEWSRWADRASPAWARPARHARRLGLSAYMRMRDIPSLTGARPLPKLEWGQHAAPQAAFYDFCISEGLASGGPAAEGLIELARSTGWWWGYGRTVVMTERPCELHLDPRGRLHNDAGAAILYPDGWGVWAVHGAQVPKNIIEEPGSITVKDILHNRVHNAEVRRVMVERYGAARFVRDAGGSRVSSGPEGTLYRMLMPGDETIAMLEVRNSTPEPDGSYRTYWLRVPPNIFSAHEAVAWTFETDQVGYRPEVES